MFRRQSVGRYRLSSGEDRSTPPARGWPSTVVSLSTITELVRVHRRGARENPHIYKVTPEGRALIFAGDGFGAGTGGDGSRRGRPRCASRHRRPFLPGWLLYGPANRGCAGSGRTGSSYSSPAVAISRRLCRRCPVANAGRLRQRYLQTALPAPDGSLYMSRATGSCVSSVICRASPESRSRSPRRMAASCMSSIPQDGICAPWTRSPAQRATSSPMTRPDA